jgi:hypothetical protein
MKRMAVMYSLALAAVLAAGCSDLAGSDKAITSFSIETPARTGTIDETAHTIFVKVPYGTDVTSLVAAITHTGTSVEPASGVAQDFTVPVTYTVTAEDGTTQAYVATVSVVSFSSLLPSGYRLAFKAGRASATDAAVDCAQQGLTEANTGDIASYFSMTTDSGAARLKCDTSAVGSSGCAYVEVDLTTDETWPQDATLIVRSKDLSATAGFIGMCVDLMEPGQNQADIRTVGSKGEVRFGNGAGFAMVTTTEWHTFRVTYEYSTDKSYVASVYVDESSTPAISSKTITQAANGDMAGLYIGDGSSTAITSCLYDYIVLITDGAFSPSEKSMATIETETGVDLQ